MPAQPKAKMTVDEFLAWSATQPGRFELVDGDVFSMSPERARHARAKLAMHAALVRPIREAGASCEAFPDGMTVRIDGTTAYEPDALVHCGPRLDDDAVEATNPVIVVEVLSSSTGPHDTGAKLAGYFSVASIQHYLIVDPLRKLVIHHRRTPDAIETRIATEGILPLEPPGIGISLGDLFTAP